MAEASDVKRQLDAVWIFPFVTSKFTYISK
jgi:hypothetical protein